MSDKTRAQARPAPSPVKVATSSQSPLLQRRATNATEPADVPPIVHEVLASSGQPLDAETRTFMEARFGHDFSQVHIYTDAQAAESAKAVNALAYTVGRDVVFGTARYAPGTSEGQQLLAHELTHVVQQEGAATSALPTTPGDRTEEEAEAVASKVLELGSVTTLSPTGMRLARAEPEIMSTRRPRYRPGERKASYGSSAGVDILGDYSFLLFNFGVNDALLKQDHQEFLETLVASFKLSDEKPKAVIRLVQGYTDLVDTETVNRPLRQRRADAVVTYLVRQLGVPLTSLDVVEGAPAGALLAENTTPESRARNRAVMVVLESLSEPQKQHDTKRVGSTKWALTSVGSVAAGGKMLGIGVANFILEDRSSPRKQKRDLVFVGAGLVGGPSLFDKLAKVEELGKGAKIGASVLAGARPSVSLPQPFSSPEYFDTVQPYTFEDFEGPGHIDMVALAGFGGAYQAGYARFYSIKRVAVGFWGGQGIWIGGFQASGAWGAPAAVLVGKWVLTD